VFTLVPGHWRCVQTLLLQVHKYHLVKVSTLYPGTGTLLTGTVLTGTVHTGMYGLLAKCEVKMAGYWPSSFFCVFMDRDGVEVLNFAKKERGQYPAILTEQAWSIKDLLYGFRGNFFCGTRRVFPSRQDGSILPARVANHSAGFDSSCPLTQLAIQ